MTHEIPLRDAIAQPVNRELDKANNRILLRRPAYDLLHVTPRRGHLVFSPGEPLTFDVEPRLLPVGAGSSRFREGVQATQDTANAVARALAPLGIRNPATLLMSCKVGEWSLEDFQEKAAIEKAIDVTEQLAASGTYRVTFQYTSGWNGAATLRAALVVQPRDGSGKPVEVCVDEHQGNTGNRSENNVYSLRLGAYDPSLRYQLVVRIRGTRPQDQQPGRTGCSGEITFQRERDPDWQVQIMAVKPSDE